MANHNETGKKGELIAVQILHHKGYEVLYTNWRFKRLEVDIIARQRDTLVFVEVKTRKNLTFGPPEEFVTLRKQNLLYDAAAAFMEEIGHEGAIRFDIIAISIKNDGFPDIQHLEDAFFPEIQ